jgi:hypothetical protein
MSLGRASDAKAAQQLSARAWGSGLKSASVVPPCFLIGASNLPETWCPLSGLMRSAGFPKVAAGF